MAFTPSVSQVIDKAGEHERLDPYQALDLFNEAHHYICSQLHLYPIQYWQLSLVAGQAEYPWFNTASPNLLKTWQCNYFTGPNSWSPVRWTNVDTLIQDYGPGWNYVTSGTPSLYYERGGNIGFYPQPDTTTGAYYPYCSIEYDEIPILTMDDTLPPVDTVYPWVYYICWLQVRADPNRSAAELDQEREAYWKWFQESMHRLRESVYGRVARDRARVGMRIPMPRRP